MLVEMVMMVTERVIVDVVVVVVKMVLVGTDMVVEIVVIVVLMEGTGSRICSL